MTVEMIQLDKIEMNPWQTRIGDPDGEYIAGLALDIARNGLLQTPVGRRHAYNEGFVELAFGHNRLRAFVHLANDTPGGSMGSPWAQMPIDVRELTDEQMANFAWSENEKRRDISAIERARAIDRRIKDFKWSYREAGENLGIDHSTITNILRLLKLPKDLQTSIQEGKLSERQAQAILVLFELPAFQENFYEKKQSIVYDALEGASSDKLRKRVEGYLTLYGRKLEGAEFSLTEAIPERGNVYCGLCSTCDKRLANRNLCFDVICFDAKTKHRRQKYLERASLQSGYPILDWMKGGSPSDIPREYMARIKDAKCPNLVLTYGNPYDDEHKIDGFAKALLVCDKRNQACTCLRGLRANRSQTQPVGKVYGAEEDEPDDEIGDYDDEETEQESVPVETTEEKPKQMAASSADLEEAARQARKAKKEAQGRREEVGNLVVKRLAEGLANDHPGAFYLLANRYSYPSDIPSLEKCYEKLAIDMTYQVVMPAGSDSLEEMLGVINRKLEMLQLEPVRMDKALVEVFGGGNE